MMSSNHNKLISIFYGQYAFITINELEIELLSVGVMISETLQATYCLLRFKTIHCKYSLFKIPIFTKNEIPYKF